MNPSRIQDLATLLSDRENGNDDSSVKVIVGGKRKAGTATGGPIMLKDGRPLTREMFETSAKNGMPFTDMQSMADWMNGWVRPIKDPFIPAPYYRVYGSDHRIPGSDIMMIHQRYKDDPQVQKLIMRSTAKDQEIPQYGPDDADQLKALINKTYQEPEYMVNR